ncbi:MAG: carboxypeptidase regulatory-like domain-containing protein, partial [Lentisphaerae bacterium]|nr:carboxypeptidase regulatory-like domain-containing protein [Lentisphaerota bacterium]
MIDIYRSIHGSSARGVDEIIYSDEEDAIDGAAEIDTRILTVDADNEGALKIVLTWSDYRGDPAAGVALVNDLDLVVIDPNGDYYLGNMMGKRGWGTSSFPYGGYVTGDAVNNVEVVVVDHTIAGDYEIQVRGFAVPQPSQAYSLAIVKGHSPIGGTPSGFDPDITFHSDGSPVMVYSGLGGIFADDMQIFVRKWYGSFGAASEFGTWRQMKDKWHYHETGWIAEEVISASVLGDRANDPSVAIVGSNDYVYVAWQQESWDEAYKDAIYFRYFNGTEWGEFGGSYRDRGLCEDNPTYDASQPVVGVAGDGLPIVAYRQSTAIASPPFVSSDIYVKKWTGAAWLGLDGSAGGKLPLGNSLGRGDLDMSMDSAGLPVLVWTDTIARRIKCYRWTGAAWSQVGGDLGSQISASKAKVSCDAFGGIYVAWQQSSNPGGGENSGNIRVAYSSGGAWSGIGGSMTYPGISGETNVPPFNPDIGAWSTNVFVAWQSGDGDGNSVFVKKWDGAQWAAVGGADTQPGAMKIGSRSTLKEMDVSKFGLPVFAVENNRSGSEEVIPFGLVGHTGPPAFLGIRTAVGSESNTVALGWQAINDPGGAIDYYIFKTPGPGWDAADTNIPPATDAGVIASAFGNEIAMVSDVSGYTETGLVNDTVWYWGVRAENNAGFRDSNTILRLAGPYDLLGDADGDWLPTSEELRIGTDPVDRDTDGDKMWDGWEWYYSTWNDTNGTVSNTVAHTNLLAMDPLDNGVDNLATTNEMDGAEGQHRFFDLDGDDMLNIEEFNYWRSHAGTGEWSVAKAANPTNWWLNPTDPDTDKDTMPDGWEYLNGLDAGDASDKFGDLEPDGLTNWEEYAWGTDPNHPDSDYDGVSDGDEVHVAGTFPGDPDTDGDGIDDNVESSLGGDPLDQDSNNNDLDDNTEAQLGYDDLGHTNDIVHFLLMEDCETGSFSNWTMSVDVGMWHRTLTEPSPQGTNRYSIPIAVEHEHTTNHSMRFAGDVHDGTNLNATYDQQGKFSEGWLVSTSLNPNAAGLKNMYISWMEYYETEPHHDICELSASRDGGLNWTAVRPAASGLSYGWLYQVGDLNDFVLDTNVIVRFRFKARNVINNAFRGWWVDDIKIYGGGRIFGTVRDLNGSPIKGANVFAIGRGGVTNIVYGHRYVYPGLLIADGVTDAEGNYAINGLFRGQYYVKATATGFQSEFWNGVLYTNADFYLAYGQEIFGGVPGVTDATNGLLGLTNLDDTADCDFELAPGGNPGRIGVLFTNRDSEVYLGQFVTNLTVWNGNTSSPAMVPYTTTNAVAGINEPDYELAPMLPGLYDHAGEGDHMAWLHPGWPGAARMPVALLPVRDGEITFVTLSSNQVTSVIDVRADVAGYRVILDGVDTGELTPGIGEAITLDVLEGEHFLSLAPTGTVRRWIAPTLVTAPGSSRATALFAESVTDGEPGSITVDAVDIHGGALTNASIFVNGMLVTSSDVGGALPFTPLTIGELQYGLHYITVLQEGYVTPAPRALNVFTGQTTKVTFTIPEADVDYDLVGDALEMDGYTDIFAYSGSSDPDADGISSAIEYEQFLLHDVRMNIFNADTDSDELSDGIELGYDGNTNSFGFTVLSTNAAFNDAAITVRFVGKFLEGESGLRTPGEIGTNGSPISIEGDEVKGLSAAWVEGDFGSPWLRYPIPSVGESYEVINASYLPGTEVFTDLYPDRSDSDGDGMWDGFEHMFSGRTVGVPRTNRFSAAPPVVEFSDVGLRPLEASEMSSDPDFDGLVNGNEFLGPDHSENTNDWTRPDDPDTDRDGMPDGWEWNFDLDAGDADDAQEDPDIDGLVNLDEWLAGTDPHSRDTDTDLITDGEEVHKYFTDPTLLDTDLDGIIDGWEVISSTGDPLNPDGGFFPTWNGGDMDEDGFIDGPTDWDTDGDGMPDGFEVIDAFGVVRPPGLRLDPSNPNDAALDYDGDGLSNYEEWLVRDGKVGLSPNDFLPRLPVFGETGGVVVVEMESFPLEFFPEMEWEEETNYPGYTGEAYITDVSLWDDEFPPYSFEFRPFYYVDIFKAGTYTLELRHRHANAGPDVQNMVWVRVDNGDWIKTVSPNSVLTWVYDTDQFDELDTPIPNTYTFGAGRHIIEFAEGLVSNSLDRFHLYHSSATAPDESVPESEIVDYVDFYHFIWDYPTEPFDSDSDDDGIPDGWEAWHGLHPRDPIPNPETVLGFLLRYWDLWLFSDLDNDGVHNRNEYDYRFVIDPDADPNALTGSLHPWIADTDEDGLVDGDEIKSQRTNPLNQDTDGDNLSDGQGVVGRWGEVETDIENPEDFERALNDMWVYLDPIGPTIGVWVQVSPDRDPPWTDVYSENTSSYVAVEIEDNQFLDPSVWPRNRLIPENWEYDVYLGVTNLTYESSALLSPDAFDQLLFYRVWIETPGIYQLAIRTYYDGPFFPTPDEDFYYSDCSYWAKIDSGAWKKITTDDTGVRANTWNFYTKEVVYQTGERPQGYLLDAIFPLGAGLHTIAISGRTWDMKFDRLVVHLSEVDPADPGLSLSPMTGEVVPLMPTRRWGGAGAVQAFNIDDPNQEGGDQAVYAGGLVFRDQIARQLLLRNNTFVQFGGRDGKEFFNEIWELKGLSFWSLTWQGVLGQVEAAEGELVAATKAFVESGAGIGTRNRGRPRPGGAPGYVYYDGDPGTEPYEVWGEDGQFNKAHTAFVTGWDAQYNYYGGFAHDEVEDYTHTYEESFPAYYVSADDTSEFVHRWGSEADAFQTNRHGTVFDEIDNKVWIGASGPSSNEVFYSALNIGPVMNTPSDYLPNGFVAQIEFVSAIVVTNPFQVMVIGELYNELDGVSSEVPAPHATLTSPPDYNSDPPSQRLITDLIDPEWTINTVANIVTIPAAGINETVRINVTDQVGEMFTAAFGGTIPPPTWELGNHMGFVFIGMTNSPGIFKYWEENAVLRIQISDPPWRFPNSEIWVPLFPEVLPHERKSAAMAYDYANELFTLFGGIDGNRVLDDTWTSAGGLAWDIHYPAHRPPARWGHGMVYAGGLIIVFGGFNENNKPLNDLW